MKDHVERIEELENEMRSRGASFYMAEDLDEEIYEWFLRHALDFEETSETTIRQELLARGHEMPCDLWELIARLAEMNIVIEHTDHLDDAALFQDLLTHLDEPVQIPDDPDTIMHVGIAGDDAEIYLRYYATETDREDWRQQFPGEEIPPREPAPFDRDRFLPTAEDLRRIAGAVGRI